MLLGCVISEVNLEKISVKIRLFSERNYSGKPVLEQEKNTKRLHLTKSMLIAVLVVIQAAHQGNVLLGKSFQSSK